MIRTLLATALTGVIALALALPLASQSPPAPVFSIGQPPLWRQHIALQGTFHPDHDAPGPTLTYGLFRAFSKPPSNAFNPVLGIIGVTLEGYGTLSRSGAAGVHAFATSQMLATSVGVDWDIRNGRVDPIVSWQSAIRRGGLLGRGTMLRVDWLPTRDHTLRAGITVPIAQPLAGRTRPGRTKVTLPA